MYKESNPKDIIKGGTLFGIVLIITLYIYSYDSVSFKDTSDIVGSIVLVSAYFLSLFIYLTNRNIIFKHLNVYKTLNKIPTFVPFRHKIIYFVNNLIKKEYKVIILLREIDKNNLDWALSQISAYKKNLLDIKKDNKIVEVEYIFIDSSEDSIKLYIDKVKNGIDRYDFIILTTLSSIFKDVILAREDIEETKRKSIKVIGSLSSISNKHIEDIINKDPDIIRVFPPDYDEAKEAVDFILSKIKTELYNKQKSNIFIIYNGLYGKAVKSKFLSIFKKERRKLSFCINSNMELNDNIYSFKYTTEEGMISDNEPHQKDNFDIVFGNTKESNNYIFIIGYEPNASSIIKHIDSMLKRCNSSKFTLLFSGTLSMPDWRKSVVNTLENSNNFKNCFDNKNLFYLKLKIENMLDNNKPRHTLQFKKFIDSKSYSTKKSQFLQEVDIFSEVRRVIPITDKNDTELIDFINKYHEAKDNYISIFTKQSLDITKKAIEDNMSLLDSKYSISKNYNGYVNILVNGDSINQYTIDYLE